MKFHTLLAGVGFHPGASEAIRRMPARTPAFLRRQPDNPHDKNAILVFWDAHVLGFVPRGMAEKLAPLIDRGVPVTCAKALGKFFDFAVESDEAPPVGDARR